MDNIVVVDSGSTNTTAECAVRSGATVLHEPRRGYRFACLKGISYLQERRAEVVVFLDGDFSDYPDELPNLLAPIEMDRRDLVIGSRTLGHGDRCVHQPVPRTGANLDQMTEALHVTAAVRGSASLVHGVQCRNIVEKLMM